MILSKVTAGLEDLVILAEVNNLELKYFPELCVGGAAFPDQTMDS